MHDREGGVLNTADPHTGLSVDSSAYRQRAQRVQLSDDPDTATAQTVQEMCRQIHAASVDPLVRAIAFNAVRTIRGGPLWMGSGVQPFASPRVMAESCWWWCKHYMRFKHHGSMFEVWSRDLGDPRTKLQLLISPDVLVRMKKLEGDCAIYTMMLCSMLSSLGLRWEICTAAVDASQPRIFGHVWPRAVLADGREPLDASHGKYPGWQVPSWDIHRLKVWDEAGREIGNQAGRFDGLHAYRGRRRGLGAAGDCINYDEAGNCIAYDTAGGGVSVGPVGSAPVYSSMPGTYTDPSGGTWANPVATVAPPASSAQWGVFANNLLKSGFTLAEINAIQPGTVVSANGAILRQATGLPVPVGNPVTTALGGPTSVLMIGGLLVGGLLLFSMSKGRG
jgi:hypothetical protein